MNKNKLISRFKELQTGVKRLLLVLGIIISWFGVMIVGEWDFDDIFYDFEEFLLFIAGVIPMFLGFWILVRIVLWIIDGFKKAD